MKSPEPRAIPRHYPHWSPTYHDLVWGIRLIVSAKGASADKRRLILSIAEERGCAGELLEFISWFDRYGAQNPSGDPHHPTTGKHGQTTPGSRSRAADLTPTQGPLARGRRSNQD